MLKLHEIRTRRSLIQTLENNGVRGQAAEAIANETAAARHAMRVAEAKVAALAEAEALFPDRAPVNLRALAALLCLLDTVGFGGREGVEGTGTARLPCFRGLGKGHKKVVDSGAWSAAILAAARELLPDAALYAPSGAVSLGISNNGKTGNRRNETSTTLSPAEIREAGLQPWAMTIAREGLRRNCGLEPWFPAVPILTKNWNDLGMTPRESWGRLVNELAES